MNDVKDITGCRAHIDATAFYAVLIIEALNVKQEIAITGDRVKVLTYSVLGNRLLSRMEWEYDYLKGIDLDEAFTPIIKWVTKGLHGVPWDLRKPVTMEDVCLPSDEYVISSSESPQSSSAVCSPDADTK